MPPSEVIYKKLLEVEKLFDEIEEQIPLAAEDWEDRTLEGETLTTMYLLKQRFTEIYNKYDEAVWPSFTEPLELANGAKLESRESTDRISWDHKGLAKKVAQRIVDESIDWETGEALRSHQEMIQEVLKYAGVGYWKVKALRKIGVDPDQFCTPKDPKKSVKVIVPKE